MRLVTLAAYMLGVTLAALHIRSGVPSLFLKVSGFQPSELLLVVAGDTPKPGCLARTPDDGSWLHEGRCSWDDYIRIENISWICMKMIVLSMVVLGALHNRSTTCTQYFHILRKPIAITAVATITAGW